jgi:hypothetical protein
MQASALSKRFMREVLLHAKSQQDGGESFGDIQATILNFQRHD